MKTKFLIWGVVIFATFFLRLFTLGDYFVDSDTYFHYAFVDKWIKEGKYPLELVNNNLEFAPPIFYLIPLIIQKITGISLFNVIFFLPVFIGLIQIILIYFIVKIVFDKNIALLSCLFLAVSNAHLYRTMGGFYRGDTVYMLFFLLSLFLFLRFLKEDNFKKKLVYCLSASLILSIGSLAWKGYLFGSLCFFIFFIIVLINDFIKNKKKDAVCLFLGVFLHISILFFLMACNVIITPLLIESSNVFEISFYGFYLPLLILFVFFMLVSYANEIPISLDIEIKKQKSKKIFKILKPIKLFLSKKQRIVLSIIFFILLSYYIIASNLINFLISAGDYLAESAYVKILNIAETKPPDFDFIFFIFGITLFVFPFGFIFLFKKQNKQKLLLLIWFLVCIYLSFLAMRFAFLASFAEAVLVSLVMYNLIKVKKTKFLLVIPLSFLIVNCSLTYYRTQTTDLFLPSEEWINALNWIKDNTNQEEGVVIFWDRGPWILGISQRKTYVDSVNQDITKIKEITRFWYEEGYNYTNLIKRLKEQDYDYILIFSKMLSNLYVNKNREMINLSIKWNLKELNIFKIFNNILPEFKQVYNSTDIKLFEIS